MPNARKRQITIFAVVCDLRRLPSGSRFGERIEKWGHPPEVQRSCSTRKNRSSSAEYGAQSTENPEPARCPIPSGSRGKRMRLHGMPGKNAVHAGHLPPVYYHSTPLGQHSRQPHAQERCSFPSGRRYASSNLLCLWVKECVAPRRQGPKSDFWDPIFR